MTALAEEEVNRITTAQGVLDAFNRIVDFSTSIMVTLAVVFVIYTGFMFATAQGDETKITTAKRQTLYAVIAIVLIILSLSAFKIIGGFISGDVSTSTETGVGIGDK